MVLPDLSDWRIAPVYAVVPVALALVWFLGGKPEKAAFGVLLLMLAAQIVLHSIFGEPRFDQIDYVSATADAIGLIGIGAVALYADRVWVIGAFAMAVLSALSHYVRLNTDMLGFSYAQFEAVPTVVMLALVFVGIGEHQYRQIRLNKQRDWVALRKNASYRKALREASKHTV